MHFGTALESDMENATKPRGKSKKQMSEAEQVRRRTAVLNQFLGTEEVRRFRDPAAARKA